MKKLLLFVTLGLWTLDCFSATYYVSKAGSDAHACSTTDSAGTNKLTVTAGIGCLASGDTLFIHSGSYLEQITSAFTGSTSGASWGSPTTIGAYSGETVTLVKAFILGLNSANYHYIIFDHLIFDGSPGIAPSDNCISLTGGVHHIRFNYCEIKNGHISGVQMISSQSAGAVTANEFLYCNIHDNGKLPYTPPTAAYGIYMGADHTTVDHCDIHHNAGYGIHGYNNDTTQNWVHDNVITNNKIHDNGIGDVNSVSGMILHVGYGNLVYNNLVYNNQGGISVGCNGAPVQKIYNNTIYGNVTQAGLNVRAECTGAGQVELKNNIVYSNSGGDITDHGTSTIKTTNLTTNPTFADATGTDFHILAGSAAKDAGTTISLVATDFDGFARPQGSAYDIGAYEFITNVPPPVSTIAVTYPNGGENLIVGTAINITWTSNDTHTVKLELSRDGGVTYPELIVTGISQTADSNNSYQWAPTAPQSYKAKIQVTNLFDSVSDASNSICNIRGKYIK